MGNFKMSSLLLAYQEVLNGVELKNLPLKESVVHFYQVDVLKDLNVSRSLNFHFDSERVLMFMSTDLLQ